MKQIIPPINTPDGRFTDGNGSTIKGTPVTADWLNNTQDAVIDLQKEITKVITDSGITINPADQTQLIQAIKKLLPVNATVTQKGIVQLNNTVTSTSTTLAGTANSVKTAYDKAVEALGVASSKAPTSHVHTIAQITGLETALAGKASSSHTHVIADVTNLQTTLDGKASSTHNHDTVYAKISHTHTIAQVTDLQNQLNGKATTSHTHADLVPTTRKINGIPLTGDITISTSGAPAPHTHTIADITNLQTTLDGKAPTTHNHTIAQVTGLQTQLDQINTKVSNIMPYGKMTLLPIKGHTIGATVAGSAIDSSLTGNWKVASLSTVKIAFATIHLYMYLKV